MQIIQCKKETQRNDSAISNTKRLPDALKQLVSETSNVRANFELLQNKLPVGKQHYQNRNVDKPGQLRIEHLPEELVATGNFGLNFHYHRQCSLRARPEPFFHRNIRPFVISDISMQHLL